MPKADRVGPESSQLSWSHEGALGCEMLWSWGPQGGDVGICKLEGGGVFTLLGYVAEADRGPAFRDQATAAKFLSDSLQRNFKPSALKELLGRLHGSFGMFARSAAGDRIICATDRMGSRPLWCFQSGDRLAISSHASAIASAFELRALDPSALASLLLYGGPVEPRRALFEGVSQIGAGTILEIQGSASPVRHPWYTFVHRPDARLSRADWVERVSGALMASAKRILGLDEQPMVFFSGGTDSRLAAAALKAAGGNPLLLTLGDSTNNEIRVARQAARALGLRHEVMLRDRLWYLRGLRRAVVESGGSFVWTHAHFSQAAEKMSQRMDRASFILGDFCEAFSKLCCSVEAASRGPWVPDAFAREFDQIPLPLYQPRNRAVSLSLLQPAVREEAEALLRSDLAGRYVALHGSISDPAILADQFLRWDNAGTIATFFMFLDLRSGGADRNLMFDRDVHELLEILPAKLRDGANLGASLIRRLAPRAAWIPSSNSLLPLCFPPVAHRASKSCKPWLGRVRRWWLKNPYTTTGSWPSRHVLYVNEPGWRSYIEGLMPELDALDGRVFDRDAMRHCWTELANGQKDRADDLEKVILLAELNRMVGEGIGPYVRRNPAELAGSENISSQLETVTSPV